MSSELISHESCFLHSTPQRSSHRLRAEAISVLPLQDPPLPQKVRKKTTLVPICAFAK